MILNRADYQEAEGRCSLSHSLLCLACLPEGFSLWFFLFEGAISNM